MAFNVIHTFIAMTTLWGSGYDEALARGIEEFQERYGRPSVVLLHPKSPEIEIPAGLKEIRKSNVPQGEVWVG